MGTNGLTKYEGGVPPQPIAGWSAGTLVLRGVFIELFGFLMVIPVAIAAVGRHDVWTGFFFSVLVVAAVTGGMLSIRGYRKGSTGNPAGIRHRPTVCQAKTVLVSAASTGLPRDAVPGPGTRRTWIPGGPGTTTPRTPAAEPPRAVPGVEAGVGLVWLARGHDAFQR